MKKGLKGKAREGKIDPAPAPVAVGQPLPAPVGLPGQQPYMAAPIAPMPQMVQQTNVTTTTTTTATTTTMGVAQPMMMAQPMMPVPAATEPEGPTKATEIIDEAVGKLLKESVMGQCQILNVDGS